MQLHKLRSRIFAATLAVLATLGAMTPANADLLYRAVTVEAGTAVVAWIPGNFRVDGGGVPGAGTLSFFRYADDNAARAAMPAAQCFVRVDLVDSHDAQPGATAPVGNNGINVGAPAEDLPRPFPWTVNFDNNPAGHWSIPRAQITDRISNNVASRVAAVGFFNLAITAGSNVALVDGTVDDCVAQ